MIILKILQNYNKDNSWFYLTVRAKLSHLISYSLREDIDRSVLKGPVGMVVAADVKASCWASGLDLGQCNLDHWTKAFDLVEKWNAIGDVHMAGSNKDNLNYCVEDLHFHSEIKFPISEETISCIPQCQMQQICVEESYQELHRLRNTTYMQNFEDATVRPTSELF